MAVPDKYKNFKDLEKNETGKFAIHSREHAGTVAVLAPHGGKIEPGTLELADAIAGNDLSFYAFEGRKKNGNKGLHITSHNFDEPCCMALVARAPSVVTIHGKEGKVPVAYVGGLNKALRSQITASLAAAGFVVKDDPKHKGLAKNNICNRGQSGEGVQLELTKGLRDSLSSSTVRFAKFVSALRNCIKSEDAE